MHALALGRASAMMHLPTCDGCAALQQLQHSQPRRPLACQRPVQRLARPSCCAVGQLRRAQLVRSTCAVAWNRCMCALPVCTCMPAACLRAPMVWYGMA